MATRVVAICREAGFHNRLEARLDNGLVLFITQDEIYDQHRHFPSGAFAADPCRFAAMILGMEQ